MIACSRFHAPTRVMRGALAIALFAGVLGPAPQNPAAAKRGSPRELIGFANPTAVTIAEGAVSSVSTIAVSGFEAEVADIDVTLFDINHSQAADLDILLVGPGGQSAYLVSDVGNNAANATLLLDDQAPSQVPSTGALPNGTFQPTNFQSGDFWPSPPAPPAQPPSGSQLGVFNSTNPNGNWRLFLQDDAANAKVGALGGGWSLRITSANGVPNAAPDRFAVKAGKTLSAASGVLENDADPDGDILTAILAGQPKKGQVTLQPDGSFTYKSRKKAKGADSFTYLAQDPGGLSDLETVTIQIKKAKKKHKK